MHPQKATAPQREQGANHPEAEDYLWSEMVEKHGTV